MAALILQKSEGGWQPSFRCEGSSRNAFEGELRFRNLCGLWPASPTYRQLCAKEITAEMMQKLEKEIPVILCKMEKKFPPGFFNPMQHLFIHLPYEAKVGSPVQHRCMYHIERALRYLKPMVGNRARVEGSIAEAFILKEVAYFSCVYFADEHNINAPTMQYNIIEEPPCSNVSIFVSRGTTVGSSTSYYPTSEERMAGLLYMYANIGGMEKYFE
jgi:hypothetical protein